MRTYDAIDKISKKIIDDRLCEALILKGSIGRGEDDEFSDVDMYAIVTEEKMQDFLDRRLQYLAEYKKIVYYSYANFVGPQIIAIYEDGLHFDLYAVTEKTFQKKDEIKILYDSKGIFNNYEREIEYVNKEEFVYFFGEILYYLVEADGAYKRGNYPWVANIIGHSLALSSKLLRYFYDKEHAYLGLKNINDVIPEDKFLLIKEASENLKENGIYISIEKIFNILDFFVDNIDEEIRLKLNLDFYTWIKSSIGTVLY